MNTDHEDFIFDIFEDDDDADSIASLESEGVDYPIERILAEVTGKNGHVWYLVKWRHCPLVRSSWECVVIFTDTPWIYEEWQKEKRRQAEGKSKPLNIDAFNQAVVDVETAERQRRRLRRLRKQAENVLAAIKTS